MTDSEISKLQAELVREKLESESDDDEAFLTFHKMMQEDEEEEEQMFAAVVDVWLMMCATEAPEIVQPGVNDSYGALPGDSFLEKIEAALELTRAVMAAANGTAEDERCERVSAAGRRKSTKRQLTFSPDEPRSKKQALSLERGGKKARPREIKIETPDDPAKIDGTSMTSNNL